VTPAEPSRALARWGAVLAGVVAAGALSACSTGEPPPQAAPSTAPWAAPASPSSSGSTPTPNQSASGTPARVPGAPRVEVLASGLEVPWDLAFLPDGRMLVTERPGSVRLVQADGTVQDRHAARVAVSAQGEGGLLGIELDPRFAQG
jgi:glucose/arabinose dehydrogenase